MQANAQKLRNYRKLNNLEPAEVAFMLGMSEAEYVEIECGVGALPLKQLLRLCQFYQIDPGVFLDDNPRPPAEPPPLPNPKPESPRERLRHKPHIPPYPRTSEPEAGADVNADFLNEGFSKRPKKPTPKQAVQILKAHGTIITEEEAFHVLDFMEKMAKLVVDDFLDKAPLRERLAETPGGFAYDGKGECCHCCHQPFKAGWYDEQGMKCMLCQEAIRKGIIPAHVLDDDALYYTEYDLKEYFNLEGKTLRHWLKQGLLKSRVVPLANGKGKHYQVFLLEDNDGFLPPKSMLECHEYLTEERDGEKWEVPLRWYQVREDAVGYLKDYGIVKYLKFTQDE